MQVPSQQTLPAGGAKNPAQITFFHRLVCHPGPQNSYKINKLGLSTHRYEQTHGARDDYGVGNATVKHRDRQASEIKKNGRKNRK